MRGYETRHLFMAVAIALLLLSPVFILLAPLFIANTLYHTPESWYVFVSGMSYLVYGIGCFFLVLAVFMLFLLAGQKFSIIVSLALLIRLAGVSLYCRTKLHLFGGRFNCLPDNLLKDSMSTRGA